MLFVPNYSSPAKYGHMIQLTFVLSLLVSSALSGKVITKVARLQSSVFPGWALAVYDMSAIYLSDHYLHQDAEYTIITGLAKASPGKAPRFNVSFRTTYGAYLRDIQSTLYPELKEHIEDPDYADFAKDVTFFPVKGLANRFAFSFESCTKPNHYISIDHELTASLEQFPRNAIPQTHALNATWIVTVDLPFWTGDITSESAVDDELL